MTLEPLRIAWLPLLDYATTPPQAEPPLTGLRRRTTTACSGACAAPWASGPA
jgi:hypothetical protein